MTRIEITPALQAAIDAVRAAAATYRPGGESADVIERPKLALANAVLEALRTQALLDRLPRRADRVAFVRVEAARRRRRR